jgi:hypothetical protein
MRCARLEKSLKPKKVKYVRSIVSYLDILGFHELIKTKRPGEISRILRILAESVKPSPIFKADKFQFTKFSDTVIRSIPVNENLSFAFTFELRSVLNAQIALISEGIPIRGAVTIGDIVQSWGVVYGPAVIRAYSLESQRGSPPRIVIDEEALAEVRPVLDKNGESSILAALVKEEGSATYIDYLRAGEYEFRVPEQEYPLFLAKHRDLVRHGLSTYATQPKVLPKYEWLKEYHDSAIEDLAQMYGARATQRLKV